MQRRFLEFFAGGGMARAGLGSTWSCLWANDVDEKKCASYVRNWGSRDLLQADVAELTTDDLPSPVDLAWASFPCQDLSLAGSGTGLNGARSGTFWPFWNLMAGLAREHRAPRLIVIENVCGTLTSHGGQDFAAICSAMAAADYRIGALVIDAVAFVPQSRPRLFLVAVRNDDRARLSRFTLTEPRSRWITPTLQRAFAQLPEPLQQQWLWWKLAPPPARTAVLADLIEAEPTGVPWHTRAETQKLLDMMSPLHRQKVATAQRSEQGKIGAVYKRTRADGKGGRTQRAEVRFDNVSGCLRTPGGGSSRQILLFVTASNVRSRLLSPREATRLMGLPDHYQLPSNYNEAYRLAGDGIVVPIVRHLARNLLEPLLATCEEAGSA